MITATIKYQHARLDAIKKLIDAAILPKHPEALITVTKEVTPKSRAERYAKAQSLISEGRSIIEELKDELSNWYDGLPENLQNGEKAEALQTAIQELEDAQSEAEGAEMHEINFPSMY
jgi:hypothetical protein